jgi:hypothetical protein
MGLSPSEFCSLPKSRTSLEAFLLSCRLLDTGSEDPLLNYGFRALLPPEEPFSPSARLTPTGDVPLLGFSSLRLSPSRPCYPFGSTPLSHFTPTGGRSRWRPLCLRVFLARGRMDLHEISGPFDVVCLSRFPLRSSPRRSLVNFFHRVDRCSLLNIPGSTLRHRPLRFLTSEWITSSA